MPAATIREWTRSKLWAENVNLSPVELAVQYTLCGTHLRFKSSTWRYKLSGISSGCIIGLMSTPRTYLACLDQRTYMTSKHHQEGFSWLVSPFPSYSPTSGLYILEVFCIQLRLPEYTARSRKLTSHRGFCSATSAAHAPVPYPQSNIRRGL